MGRVMPGFHRSLRAARRAVGCGERGRRARGRADGAAGGRQLLSGRLRARRVRDSQIRRTIDGQIRRVAGDQVRRVALVVVRVLLRHRLPPFPVRLKSRRYARPGQFCWRKAS